eukprot:TRINITY_DN716_c0_g1_i2.p1 TRINITY_DN716_c0_g1~~TRINITY_DN716_c0_g1_i2.p1  ORF type:complete len:179 (-),score=43.67 TRINITY_DN716_c0_g1_i2:71-607(-)
MEAVVSTQSTGDEALLYLGAAGKIYCFDPVTHEEKWSNPLKGLGTFDGCTLVLMDLAPTTQSSQTVNRQLLIGMNGKVVCVKCGASSQSGAGEILWATPLPGCGYEFVTLTVYRNLIYAACFGIVYVLDPKDGEIVLKDELKGMGYGSVLIATNEKPSIDFSSCSVHGHYDQRKNKTT